MQAALCNIALPHIACSKTTSNGFPMPRSSPSSVTIASQPRTAVVRAAPASSDTVDYSSMTSVFPAEACETIGGDACLADIYPEARIESNATRVDVTIKSEESVEREYLDYASAKTVFPAEACDDLGGEFCERPYQRGVY
ncbi:light-regulated protein, chloroplastic-like [Punica granatum]|uniref:Uncharacterized protein n=2 Tax=Punica granatum TaxID=22663 RepID=A0A218XSG4_PUNGR|nr:light-regulated protein, chloroplastic-like [Punica granatum]OWM87758.1 hypothetical protein CDL15_Pgr016454 [Punica granatum]PKI53366.1 hypothetical protein CRG98_026245 [Punica granatum]